MSNNAYVRDDQLNWEIYKQDTKAIVTRTFDRNRHDNYKLNKTKFYNNLFDPISLSFKDGSAFAIKTSTKKFDAKEDMSAWLKSNRPLVYTIYISVKLEERGDYFMSDLHLSVSERLNNLKPESINYVVRYFEAVGTLPTWKYYMQWFFGKYNFKLIRPFLYRMFVLNF